MQNNIEPAEEAAALQSESMGRRLKLKVRCGSCVYMNKRCSAYEAPCGSLGRTADSASCKFFEPNYSSPARTRPDLITDIGKLVKDMPEPIRHLIAYAIVNGSDMERVTEAQLGFSLKLGQPVMINLSSPRVDYVNCWFRAISIGVTNDRQSIIVASRHTRPNGVEYWAHATIRLHDDNILTAGKMWQKHEKRLRKQSLKDAPAQYLVNLTNVKETKHYPSDGWVPQQLVQVKRNEAGKLVKVDPDFEKLAPRKSKKKHSYIQTKKDGITTLTITN